MEKVEKLTELLKRLNTGEDPAKVKKEAQQFLATIDPKDLTLAEQKLIEAGLKPDDLRHLCAAHMEMLGDELTKMKARLKPGHVIHTMVSEHDMILGFLNGLEKENQAVQKGQKPDQKKLNHIADHLVGAEPHHKREEDVLFPELEKRGIFGPPQIMRTEHVQLRKLKEELKEITESKINLKKLDAVATSIIFKLRDHIFKENNILYPTALEVIPEEEVWQKMKIECDKIGYCCFTPAS